MTEVALVQMPFAGVERPSIALGIISAALKEAGISTRSVYANISFGDQVGLDVYRMVERAHFPNMLGEWLFAMAAFGPRENQVDCADYQDACGRNLERNLLRSVLRYRGLNDTKELLSSLRKAALDFVEDQARIMLKLGVRVVGCTSMFQQHTASLALLRAIKRTNPSVITVIGGANCAGVMGLTTHRAFDWIDYTVTGEIDNYVAEFFGGLLTSSIDRETPTLPPNVLGPHHRGQLGDTLVTDSNLTTNMDQIPTPDYDDYFETLSESSNAKYILPSLQFESSRGCWWGVKHHCTFCGLNATGMSFRFKSPRKVKEELNYLSDRHSLRRFSSVDNIFTLSYFRTLLPTLASDPSKYEIFYETKANLTRDQVEMFARSGVRWIQPGIESLHDETLRLLRKGTTSDNNIQLLKDCLDCGVQPTWNLLVGIPGEHLEWIKYVRRLLPLLFHLPPPQCVVPIRFDRYSPYFEQSDQYDLYLEPFECYGEIFPLNEMQLRDIAYYFEDTCGTSAHHRTGPWLDEVRKSARLISKWQRRYFSNNSPKLVFEDQGEAIVIYDSRTGEGEDTHLLTGLSAKIYRLIQMPTKTSRILERLRGLGENNVDMKKTKSELAHLVDLGLAWRTDARIVALACNIPRRAMPSVDQAPPWGTIDLPRLFHDRRIHEKNGG